MRIAILLLFCCLSFLSFSQEDTSNILDFKEYLGLVKKFHPIVKQGELKLDIGEATLLKARGAFDPKIEIDYDRKKFKDTEYFDKLNTVFKIPTWYGVEFNATFEENQGVFLNNESIVPDDGLFSAGVTFSVAQGLLINDRMATLKKGKFFREQSAAERDILVNQVLFDASLAYFNWLQAYNDTRIYDDFLKNAEIRLEGIKKNVEVGESPAIDSTEAKIAVQSRLLSMEDANLKFIKASLVLSNYLWLENNVPIELQTTTLPNTALGLEIDLVLQLDNLPLSNFTIENHPKLTALNAKMQGLEVDKRLMKNRLLPQLDLKYNFFSETPEVVNTFNTANYKAGVQFSFPLFLRKERGDLNLASAKLNDARFELISTEVSLKNKILQVYNELDSYETQKDLIDAITADYQKLVVAEERKFSFGESSLFLINTREKSLIDSKLKQNELENKLLSAKARLFNTLVAPIDNL